MFCLDGCDSLPESLTVSPVWGSMTGLSDEERRINEVLHEMWRYIHTYTMRFADKVFTIGLFFEVLVKLIVNCIIKCDICI